MKTSLMNLLSLKQRNKIIIINSGFGINKIFKIKIMEFYYTYFLNFPIFFFNYSSVLV